MLVVEELALGVSFGLVFCIAGRTSSDCSLVSLTGRISSDC